MCYSVSWEKLIFLVNVGCIREALLPIFSDWWRYSEMKYNSEADWPTEMHSRLLKFSCNATFCCWQWPYLLQITVEASFVLWLAFSLLMRECTLVFYLLKQRNTYIKSKSRYYLVALVIWKWYSSVTVTLFILWLSHYRVSITGRLMMSSRVCWCIRIHCIWRLPCSRVYYDGNSLVCGLIGSSMQ